MAKPSKGKSLAHARHGEIYNEIDAAKVKLRAGDVEGAMVNLMAADQVASDRVSDYRVNVNARKGNGRQRKDDVACANELIKVRGKIDEVVTTLKPSHPRQMAKPSPRVQAAPSLTPVTPRRPRKKVPFTPARKTPTMPISPRQPASALNIGNKSGYSRAGGLIQAPPGAGMYMRVPFRPTGANPLANSAFAFAAAAATGNFTMQTPQLPWLTYRLRGLVIERNSDAAGASDSITVEDLREQGGPNLVIGEGRVGVESFRMGDRHLVGLRYNPIVQAPNFLEVRIRSNGPGQNGVTAGNTVLYVSAIIETIEDTTYGTVNSLTQRLNLGHFGGGQGAGYTYMTGAPVSGTIQRVPMRSTTAGAGAINASSFRLNNANNQLTLQSEQISWAELQIVGVEFGTPIKTNGLDVVTLEDLQVGGGASLFAQAGEIPGVNFLGDESGIGGGAHSMVGLRHYPLLSATNTATLTVQGRIGSTGAAGLNGTVDIPYVNILVDRLVDDVFGVQPAGARSPYAKAAGLLP
jgi:hypothetical protein